MSYAEMHVYLTAFAWTLAWEHKLDRAKRSAARAVLGLRGDESTPTDDQIRELFQLAQDAKCLSNVDARHDEITQTMAPLVRLLPRP